MLFWKRESQGSGLTPHQAVAQRLARLLESCDGCGSEFANHDFTLLATCLVKSRKANYDELLKLFTALETHDWAAVRKFQAFDGAQDDVEVYAIRGSEHLVVVAIKTYFELLQPNEVLYREVVPREEVSGLLQTLAEAEWHSF